MLKNLTFTASLLLLFTAHSQIDYGWGEEPFGSCDLETNCSMLALDTSVGNIWQVASPQKPFFGQAASFPNAILTDSINPYPTNNHSVFQISFPNLFGFNAIFSFKHKFQTDSLIDGGYIEVSYDNEGNWNNVILDSGIHFMEYFNTEKLYSPQDTLLGGIPGFSGNSGSWITTKFQWVWGFPIRSVPPDTIRLRFHFISDSMQNNLDGWMIDDIALSYGFYSGLDELNENANVSVFPNPFQQQTTIRFSNPNQEEMEFHLFDYQGKIIKEQKGIRTDNYTLSSEGIRSGMYFFRLKNQNGFMASGVLSLD